LVQPPPVPATSGIVGDAYEFSPAGANFNPPVTLTFTYDPAKVPEGIPQDNLGTAYQDTTTNEWVAIPSGIDPVNHTITAQVSHFTVFAIIGFRPPVADFKCSPLTISPDEVNAGEAVNIIMSVSNIGGAAGNYKLTLSIDGVVEATEEITLEPGATEAVPFRVAKETAGTHTVDINNITGSFVVKETPKLEISAFSVTPNYHTETNKLTFARLSYGVNNTLGPLADVQLTLKVSLDDKLVEEVSLLSLRQLELGETTGSQDYTSSQGWNSGTYSFRVELYAGGKLYATTVEELEVTPASATPAFSWVTLGEIIGATLILIAATISAILLRRRHLLRRLGQR